MGLILDNIASYILLAAIRGVWRLRCGNWPVVKGSVTSSFVSTWLRDCAVVKYKYSVGDGTYEGSFHRGFWLDAREAKIRAALFGELKAIAVRYNPASPSQSYLLEEDQDLHQSNKRSH